MPSWLMSYDIDMNYHCSVTAGKESDNTYKQYTQNITPFQNGLTPSRLLLLE